jgi:hypothetical protein
LAAAHLAEGGRSLLWAPELLVQSNGEEAEVDLCLIIDGRFEVGEAKSNTRLNTADKGTAQAAARLVHAAHIRSADEIVLATAQPAWAPGARTAIEAAIAAEWRMGPKLKISTLVGIGRHVDGESEC